MILQNRRCDDFARNCCINTIKPDLYECVNFLYTACTYRDAANNNNNKQIIFQSFGGLKA